MPGWSNNWRVAICALEVMRTEFSRLLWGWLIVHLTPAARIIAGLIGRLKYVLLAGRRKNITENLQAAFPGKSPRAIRKICREVFIAAEQNGLEQYRLELLSESQLARCLAGLELRGREHLERAQGEGRPVILVTPHYGNFMLGALRVAADGATKGVYFFYNPPERNAYAERSNRLLDRPGNHCHKIYNNLHGIKTALKVLKGQGTLCIMPDLISVTASTIYVPFLGRFFSAMSGIAFLAERSNAAVIPAYCYSVGKGVPVLEFRPPISGGEGTDKTTDDQAYELTARLFQELERQITRHPRHWRYWHVYLKRSIPFPTPPSGPDDLLRQLQGCDQIVSQDEHLAEILRQWRGLLEAGAVPPAR
jgi:Kdo2-lipid IVA lauroyltransferase/acyltransferase